MEDAHPPYLVVGHLNKVHGTRGELFVWPLTDHPESHFLPGQLHLPGNAAGDRPSATLSPLAIETVRPYRRGFLVRFAGIDDRAAAEDLRGRYLFRPFETIDAAAEDEIFYHELLGATVATAAGDDLGTVAEVFPLRPADLLQVNGPQGEILIPFSHPFVVEVDRARRHLVVDLPDGFLA